ncbi:hypothetical protein Leryth_014760 [Lithospermum erythrorhizon]|nr:hypothetical protein Leryth_014760 [Lithospermum erythrorhizon]
MSDKECGHHEEEKKKKLLHHILAGVAAFTLLILLTILLVYLILRPTKPRFILRDITVYAFNVSSPTLLTSNLQTTLLTRNPNRHIGIYYDKLDVYASYRSQQISLPTLLPKTYLGHKDVVTWSPFLYGNAVPLAPLLSQSLAQDQMVGTVMVNVRVEGRVRWRVGNFVTGKYHLSVNCPAYINFGRSNTMIMVGPAIKYQLVLPCHVDV